MQLLGNNPMFNLMTTFLMNYYSTKMWFTCMEMTLLDRYCSPGHFGTSFAIFRLTMKKWWFKRLFKLNHFNHFEMTSKEKLFSCCELNIAKQPLSCWSFWYIIYNYWINIYQVMIFPIIDVNLPFYLIFYKQHKN